MNISGIRPIIGVNDYNAIKNPELSGIPETEKQTVGEYLQEPEQEYSIAQSEPEKVFDYAGQYDPDAEYELKGTESDLLSLDVEKAISDMKKDQVLQQYQFFVGESLGQGRVTSTGENTNMFRTDENFDIP